jgi:predicted nucleic acid-binding OB-fold protein
MSNEELIKKAKITVANLASNGLLNEKQSERFCEYMHDILKEECRQFEAFTNEIKENLTIFKKDDEKQVNRILKEINDKNSDISLALYAAFNCKLIINIKEGDKENE